MPAAVSSSFGHWVSGDSRSPRGAILGALADRFLVCPVGLHIDSSIRVNSVTNLPARGTFGGDELSVAFS